jgi:hypothetical protein
MEAYGAKKNMVQTRDEDELKVLLESGDAVVAVATKNMGS